MPTEPILVPTFPRLSEYAGIWAMEPGAFRLAWDAAQRIDLAAHMKAMDDEDTPETKRRVQVQSVSARNGKTVSIISVVGTLMKQRSSFGGTSTIELRREVRQAANDPDVGAILLAIESPGGVVAGTDDLAQEVKSARMKKPVWAHVDDLCASAAYWVASQAGLVYANSKTALVGSIGTYMTIYDLSGAFAHDGVKALVFATGPLKGAGTPGAPVTEEQQRYFQALIEGSQREFDRAVRSGREMTDAELKAVRTGGVFQAGEAIANKLIDGIQSLDRTIQMISEAASARK